MLAGLTGSVGAYLLKATPFAAGGGSNSAGSLRGEENACVELLALWPFHSGVSLDEKAALAMLGTRDEDADAPAAEHGVETAGDDAADWPSECLGVLKGGSERRQSWTCNHISLNHRNSW